jgi:hypothetical protein
MWSSCFIVLHLCLLGVDVKNHDCTDWGKSYSSVLHFLVQFCRFARLPQRFFFLSLWSLCLSTYESCLSNLKCPMQTKIMMPIQLFEYYFILIIFSTNLLIIHLYVFLFHFLIICTIFIIIRLPSHFLLFSRNLY